MDRRSYLAALGTTATAYDGSDDETTLPDNTAFSPSGAFAFGLWYYNHLNSDDVYIFDGRGHEYFMKEDTGGSGEDIPRLYMGGNIFNLGSGMADQTWYYLAGVYDGTDSILYLFDTSGTLVDSATDNSGGLSGSSGAPVFADYSGGGFDSQCRLWDFRFWNAGRTQAELQTIVDIVASPGSLTTAKKTS